MLFQTAFHRIFQLLPQTARVCFRRQKWVHTRPCSKNRTQRPTRRNTGRFGWGWYHYPRSVPHVSETLRGRGLKRQTLPLLGLGRGCSRRRRGPAGLRDLFRFCRNCGLYALFQILLSVLQTLQLVLFLCKLRLSSFLFGVSVRQKNHWGLFQPDANISSELVKGFRFCHCA